MSDVVAFNGASADDWAERITACWRQSVEAIINAGRLIADAKASLPHGDFMAMCRERLPFGARTAQRLMQVAADPRLADPTHGSLLPPSWRTLFELTRLDDDQFEKRIADGTIRPDMDRKDIVTAVKQTVRATKEAMLGKALLALPDRKHGVIVEDFEWHHQTYSDVTGMDRHAANHYPTSRDAQTAAAIVEKTRERFSTAADNSVCFMWTTLQHLAIALDVLRLRGFDYRSSYAWGKDKIGLGFWSREKHEILLIGVKGHIDCPAPGTQWDSLIYAPRGEHSEKPEMFLEMIEGYFPTLPKLELNRRGPARPGWDAWGNEAESTTDQVTVNAVRATQREFPQPEGGVPPRQAGYEQH